MRAHGLAAEPLPPRLAAAATSELVGLLWHTQVPVLVQDEEHKVVALNRALLAVLGQPLQQVLGQDLLVFLPPEDHDEAKAARALAGGRGEPSTHGSTEASSRSDAPANAELQQERRLRDAQGHDHWFRFTPRAVSADDGRPLRLSILTDITAQRLATAQMDRSVHELEHWFELSPVGMLVYDQSGLVLRSNASFEALLGRTPVMLLEAAHDLQQLLAWEGEGPHADLRVDAPTLEVRTMVQVSAGRSLQLRARLRAFASAEGPLRVMAIVEDRSLEDERDLAELEIGALMDAAGVGVATYEATRGWVSIREGAASGRRLGQAARAGGAGQSGGQSMDGVPRKAVDSAADSAADRAVDAAVDNLADVVATGLRHGLSTIHLRQVEPASRPQFERLQAALREGRRAQLRYEVQLPELGRRWLMTRVEPGELTGGRPTLSVVTLDITEQEALGRERELMFNHSDVGLSHVRGGVIERANEALARMVGLPSAELAGLPLATLFVDAGGSDAALLQLWAERDAALAREGMWRGERQLRRHDGSAMWVQVTKRRIDPGQADSGLICSYVDIDERRHAREALQLQAERTRAVLDSVLVGIVTVGEGGIEWMNRSARRMFGGELADFIAQPIAMAATDEADHPLRATHYLQTLADGQAETFECRLRARDGREFWVVGNAVVTGRVPETRQITFALLDIERRRQAETNIVHAQASLQRIIDTAPLAIALFDAGQRHVLRLNTMAAQFFGQPAERVLGRTPDELFAVDEARALNADLQRALAGSEVLRREQRLPLVRAKAEVLGVFDASTDTDTDALAQAGSAAASGPALRPAARVWDTRVVAIGSAPEPQLLLVASDVTEQREAEQERFEAAVSQREMLVKEVHHRIKNNLQGVAGLLQQTAVRRPEVAALINEVVGQVQAIAQVHGLQVGATGPLRIRALLEAVINSVARTFGRDIALQVRGSPAHRYALPEAESIPTALTINELLTNAVKHSAPGDIVCALCCEDEEVTIRISNPGQLSEGFNLAQIAPGVSGLGLVRALLPRRTARLSLQQHGSEVQAQVSLSRPGFTVLEPL